MKDFLRHGWVAMLAILLTIASIALSFVCFRHQSSAGFNMGLFFLLAPILFWSWVVCIVYQYLNRRK